MPPTRNPYRGRAAIAGAANAASDVFGNLMKQRLQEDLSNREAVRNDALERARTADNLIAQGKLDPEDRDPFIKGTYTGPTVEKTLSGIFGGITKAPTMQEVPSRVALAQDFAANKIPTVGVGKTPSPSVAGEDGEQPTLPSTQIGPASSAPFANALQARADKLRAFPAEKIGEGSTGEGASLQPTNLYGKWNPDTGQLDPTDQISAGMTAGNKGSYEGQVAATTARLKGPVDTQNALNQQNALMPGAIRQAGGEAAARGAAETQTAINRAKMSGGLLPEQATFAEQQSQQYQQESRNFWPQQEAFRKMAAAANDPSPAGDIGIIYNYMKMLDPASGVQQGEAANAQNTVGVPEQIMNTYNRLLSGEKLSVNRQDYLHQARNLYTSAKSEQDQRNQAYSARAQMRGVDPSFVVRQPGPDLSVIGQQRMLNGKLVTITGIDADGNYQVR